MIIFWSDHIESHPDVLADRPRIKNTRISVEFLRGRLADGRSADELLQAYPALRFDDIQTALALAQDL